MGKWIGSIVTALILLTLTSVLGALLKGPIDEWASGDRLNAQVQLAPWIPRPRNSTVKEPPLPEEKLPDDLAKQYGLIFADLNSLSFARMVVSNDSSKVVTDVNLRLTTPYDADDVVILDAKKVATAISRPDRIVLPDLRPGDRVVVYMWGPLFSEYTFPDSLKTFSSAGKFRVRYSWPEDQNREFETYIGSFLDEYAGLIGVVSGTLLLFIFGVLAVINRSYYRALLKEQPFYDAEKARYDEDPVKFEPDVSKIQ